MIGTTIIFFKTFLAALIGLGLYFVWKAKDYLGNRFDKNKWVEENLHRLYYSIVFLFFLLVAFAISPEVATVLEKILGVDIPSNETLSNASPVLIGFAVGAVVYGVNKTVRLRKERNG